jgi:hypothetical protein
MAQTPLPLPLWPSANDAVTSGKVATNRMKKQPVAISAVLSIGTDLGPSEFSGKPSDKRIFRTPFPLVTASFALG